MIENDPQSIFEVNVANCDHVDYFRMLLFGLRRMLFFVLIRDRNVFNAQDYNYRLDKSRLEQRIFEELVLKVCNEDAPYS